MLIDEIKQLDIAKRIVLVEEIWDSIAKEGEKVELSDKERSVLEARLQSLESGTATLLSWDEIKNKIRA